VAGPGSVTAELGRVAVALPAYNAAKTLEITYCNIPHHLVDDIILVDDASQDETLAVARRLGIFNIAHERNTGYGGNQKTCYREALRRGAQVVVLLHPDYQYDPAKVPEMLDRLRDPRVDFVFASRILDGRAVENGMPRYKYAANRFLTTVENWVLGSRFTDLHTGLRAYKRRVLETIPFERNDDGFVFDSQMVMQLHWFGFRGVEVGVPARYGGDASSTSFAASLRYGLGTLGVLTTYWLCKRGLRQSPLFAAREGEA